MCGIVGISASRASRDALSTLVEDMNEVQVHRGPDSGGAFLDERLATVLAMRRLTILDAPGGIQPMASEDGRHVLVYNGEIMNATELRRDLERAGEVFASDHSDTEVLLRLMIRRGLAALPLLNGMFAFALLDRREGTLTLARDRLGIKPLYYYRDGGRFAFASELKSLLRLPFVARRLDRQSLFHYLSLMYVPGDSSIIEGVQRLLPGHAATYDIAAGTLNITRWWQLAFEPVGGSASDWRERVRATLGEATRRWTLSDVPIACSLSGGLDSSAIVGFLAQSGRTVSTYSVGFRGEGEDAWNELPLARQVADTWGCKHHEIILDPEELLGDLGKMVWHLDEPYGGGLPSWSVFKHMARDVRVGLVGSGGDELFGNYGKWRELEGAFPLLARAPDREQFRRQVFERYYYFSDADKRAAMRDCDALSDTADLLYGHFSAGPGSVRDRCAIADIETQLSDEFLAMTDRFSMAHALEARPPFLDNELVDLVRTIPANLRTHRRDLKGLLRDAVAPVLPKALLTAPKKGFVIPLKLWLRNELRPLVERLLSPERLRRQGIFDAGVFDAHVRPHLTGDKDLTTRVWGLMMFQIWHALVIENGATSAPDDLASLADVA